MESNAEQIELKLTLTKNDSLFWGILAQAESVLNNDKGERIGEFGGMVGGNYRINIKGNHYYITPKDIYNAICHNFDLSPMQ